MIVNSIYKSLPDAELDDTGSNLTGFYPVSYIRSLEHWFTVIQIHVIDPKKLFCGYVSELKRLLRKIDFPEEEYASLTYDKQKYDGVILGPVPSAAIATTWKWDDIAASKDLWDHLKLSSGKEDG
ncbi:hypothetical protein PG994_010196 [Apiospora phragmitis]|uniref:Uncharacterized protein n=1 Tax=Apiospora phragmitis TaxID=2905665 RepID=A0ABR1TP89_9PEZI